MTSENHSAAAKSADSLPKKAHLPGDELIWVFVMGDMAVFTLFFCAFAYFRGQDLSLFRESQAHLNLHYGAMNTLILLLSSWLVVIAVQAARQQRARLASGLVAAATLCGAAFSVAKCLEYRDKLALGIDMATNEFFTFYYLLTGIHFAHVLCGVGVLAYFAWTLRSGAVGERDIYNLESGAVYWHMVDLLWIIIFPLIYLLP